MKAKTLGSLALVMLVFALVPAGYLFIPPIMEIGEEIKERFMVLDNKAIACGFFGLFVLLSVCFLVASGILEHAENKEARDESAGRLERAKFEHEQLQAHPDSR